MAFCLIKEEVKLLCSLSKKKVKKEKKKKENKRRKKEKKEKEQWVTVPPPPFHYLVMSLMVTNQIQVLPLAANCGIWNRTK